MTALAGVRVLDCGDDLSAYGTMLLAGLGADVLRAVPPSRGAGATSFDLYAELGTRRLVLDPARPGDRDCLLRLATTADVVVDAGTGGLLTRAGITWKTLSAANPTVVLTRVTPFGPDGPHAGRQACDLTLLAQSGLMSLAGDPGSPPVRPAGRQSSIATGLNAAVGTLLALLHAEATGEGQEVDVAALECVAAALENAVQYWDLQQVVRRRTGSRPQEAGTGLFPCGDGHVYMMAGRLSTPRGWAQIVEWLNGDGTLGADRLKAPEWSDYRHRTTPAATATFTEIFTRFAARRGKAELYADGQARGIIICPVNTPAEVLLDEQLAHRRFFVPVEHPAFGRRCLLPRVPFHLSATPYREASPPAPADRDRGWLAPTTEGARASHRPPRSVGSPRLPLARIRVADFTWVGSGPFGTKILADHGAEVIKIETATRPDPLRFTPPFRDGVNGLNRSGYFANRNTSKQSFQLDLRTSRGIDLARRLIAKSDIVANNFSPGTMEKWGLGYEDCRKLRTDIIYLSMPMHGADGPHRAYLGYGSVIAALSGLLAATGFPDRAPVGTGTNYPDHVPNPCHAAIAVLAALRHRARTGEGQSIELSQVESTVYALGPLLLEAQMADGGVGCAVRRGNREPGMAPHGVYPAAGTDRWIAIACRTEADWGSLCGVARNAGFSTDPRFASLEGRLRHEDDLDAAIESWTARHDALALADRLQAAGLAAAVVQEVPEAVEQDPQLRHLGHWVRLRHLEMGESIYDAPPFHLSATPGRLRWPAPRLGEHTERICRDVLGLGEAEIAALREEGVLR